MTLPSLLLVQGAWHGPAAWQLLMSHLPDVDVRTVTLTSSGHDPAGLGDLYGDAAAIQEVLAEIGRPTVVLGHSYGGCPVSQAAGSSPHVRRVIYLTAMMQDVGDALLTVTGGAYPPYWDVHTQPEGSPVPGYFGVSNPEDVLYHDVEPGLARRSAEALGIQSLASVTQPLTQAAWRTVPSTYILCEDDRTIPPELQAEMAKRADRVRRLHSSHSPFLSQPAELAQVLREELAI